MDRREEKIKQLGPFLENVKAHEQQNLREDVKEGVPISVGYTKKEKESDSLLGKLWSFFPKSNKQDKFS